MSSQHMNTNTVPEDTKKPSKVWPWVSGALGGIAASAAVKSVTSMFGTDDEVATEDEVSTAEIKKLEAEKAVITEARGYEDASPSSATLVGFVKI